jgi:hypothetical protein
MYEPEYKNTFSLTLPYLFPFQERRITPSEALNHPFVSMSHMADYAHCANVKSSARMMEICCKRGNNANNNNNNSNNANSSQQQQGHPPQLQAQLMVPR